MARCGLVACLLACGAVHASFPPLPPHKPPHPPHPFNPPIAFATAIRCGTAHALQALAALTRALARRSGEGGPPIRDTPVGEPGTTTFSLNWLTDIDPLAQCNDGSPAAYYYAKGTGSSAHLWVVYLEGSMFCWGQASCSGASPRAARLR